jgi:outer membrane protein assembly factor BamA
LIGFTVLAVPPLRAQETGERIVDRRPRLYTIKRALHPLAWFEAGTRPLFGFAEGIARRRSADPSADSTASRLRFGVGRMGSGSGLGPRLTLVHENLVRTGSRIEIPLLYTYKRYESYQFHASVPLGLSPPHDRLNLLFAGSYDSRPSDNFFGIGNETPEAARTAVRTVNREVAAGVSARLSEHWKAEAHWGYRNVGVTHPRETPSAQLTTWEQDIPGLLTGAVLRSGRLAIERNSKDKQAAASRGGLQRFEAGIHEGIRKGDFSYWKYAARIQQFFPLTDDGGKVIAIQAIAESNQEKGGSTIPFFELATLGHADSLRGFDSLRLYDKSAIGVSVEYRYRIWPAFDWAFFLDEGQVAPEPGDFDIDRFHTGYGMRFIVRPTASRAVSIDVGKSSDGIRFHLNIDPSF